MATPAKKTSPRGKAPPPTDLSDLKAGVVELGGRVAQLAEALQTVNKVQERADASVKAAQKKTSVLEETMIPREEHEKIWKQEQENLIKTRLGIRRQTFVLFFVSMAALATVAVLVFHDLAVQNALHHREAVARCEQGNQFRTDDRSLWTEIIGISSPNRPLTPKEQEATKKFQAFIAKHDKLTDCSKTK